MSYHNLLWLSYGFLYLTVISLWFPRKSGIQVWHILLSFSILFGLFSQQIKPIAIIPIVLLPLTLCRLQKKLNTAHSRGTASNSGMTIFFFLSVIIICIGLAVHLFPGFYNLKILDHVYLSKDAIPFTMYLNFDKTLVGIFILGLSHQLLINKRDWFNFFKNILPLIIGIILIVIISAMILKFVRFDPKIPNFLPIWIITDLLFVCTAEEAFFRGFIQKNLTQLMEKIPFGNKIALLCASILFGLAHFAGGVKYVLLATIAGLGFGYVYDRTQHIESSIITHFSLNLTHISLFTYPMLSSAQ